MKEPIVTLTRKREYEVTLFEVTSINRNKTYKSLFAAEGDEIPSFRSIEKQIGYPITSVKQYRSSYWKEASLQKAMQYAIYTFIKQRKALGNVLSKINFWGLLVGNTLTDMEMNPLLTFTYGPQEEIFERRKFQYSEVEEYEGLASFTYEDWLESIKGWGDYPSYDEIVSERGEYKKDKA